MHCIRLILLPLAVGFLGSCAAVGPIEHDSSAPPPDFGLDLTVLSGEPQQALDTADRRTGRYVLFPDGRLHAAWADDLTASDAPPLVRTLSRDEVDALWRLVRDQGLLPGSDSTVPGLADVVEPFEGEITHLLVVTAAGDRAAVTDNRALSDQPDHAMHAITRALARLAWASDEPDLEQIRAPIRYDLGPDPYARYRTNPPAPPESPKDEQR